MKWRTVFACGQRGMALVAVLWIVAALSIMVMGLAHNLKGEARLAAQSRQIAVAAGRADAAIHLLLQEMVAHAQTGQTLQKLDVVTVPYGGAEVQVEILPVSGFIPLNTAGAPLLGQLLEVAGGVPQAAANAFAQAIVDARAVRDAKGLPTLFEAVEDLLQIPGIDYGLYAKIAPLLTTDQSGSGRVNPMAAPDSVLLVLAGGDPSKASSIAAQRAAGAVGIDTTGLIGTFIDTSATQRFRLTARVPLSEGGVVFVTRSVNLRASARDGMPWSTYRFEQRLREDTAVP